MADKNREGRWRVNFRGQNSRSQPDSLPPTKFPVAINVRASGDSSVKTRAGYTDAFVSSSVPITDLRAYAALLTDNRPRILAHNDSGAVYLDNGVLKGQVGTGGLGASMIPFRPSASPQSWMYIYNATGAKKFSAPTAGNVIDTEKVGIAEPQQPPGACPDGFLYNEFTSTHASWTPAGTAGATADATRSTDTAVAIFADPDAVFPTNSIRYSVQVGAVQYQIGETLTFAVGAGTLPSEVEDVLPPINGGTALTVQAIYYFTGTTGNCIVVPTQQPVDSSVPELDGQGNPIQGNNFLLGQVAGLRRGALVSIGGEVCLVLSVTTGPQGGIAFETSTAGAHVATETIVGVPAIVCAGLVGGVVGGAITAVDITSAITVGVGTLTRTLGTNPFNLAIGIYGTPQEDDFIHVSVLADAPLNVTELKLLFDVGDGSFTQNVLYYSVSVSALQSAFANKIMQTTAVQQLAQQDLLSTLAEEQGLAGIDNTATGSSQWTEVMFPISALTRIGDDQTKTLANCGKVQILANVAGTVNLAFGSLWVGGGGQPDVGTQGAPYLYRIRPRSITTGARGNPSPATRYGVLPRRQRVIINLPSSAYDGQIEVWDIFRYGGTVTSWRLVGTVSSVTSSFVDNVFDDAALAGQLLDFDNFEPWPTVDVPAFFTVGDGNVTAITVYGTAIVILAAAFPSTIARWLPGTLITIYGGQTYTLWNRPVAVSGGYLFRILEDAGAPTTVQVTVGEPNVANQTLPYVWGPDANGVFTAVGDPLRPGTISRSKPNDPDSTPNNIYDLTAPSEPLMGGEVIDGLSIVASSKRWWALQPSFGTPNSIVPVEMPAGRGLAAPFGHCTDGRLEFFWAKDGIYEMVPLGSANSLTDADFYNLFPHDGISGSNVTYGPYTFYAPDYSRAAQFRLAIVNSVLKAHYLDSTGTQRTMVLDMSLDGSGSPRMAWSTDVYADPICVSYQPEQPAGTLTTSTLAYKQEYLGATNGLVFVELPLSNDNGVAIAAAVATFEWDAGDLRQQKEFIDGMVDAFPSAVITVQPMSGGAAVGSPTTIAAGARTQQVISLGGSVNLNYLGFLMTWVDDFGTQASASGIVGWEEDYFPQPVSEGDAFTDWDNAGDESAKFFQGFLLEADTFNVPKNLAVRNGDTLAIAQTFPCTHNGQQVIAYSFATPFVAHLVRIEPVGQALWKPYRVKWIFQPTPEMAPVWKTQPTTHGLVGFHHIRKIVFAYFAFADVLLTITADDGTSPAVITLPSTAGASHKVEFVPTFNKGRMFTYGGVSAGNWAALLDKCEIHVGMWEREGNYSIFRNLGGVAGDQARV